MTLYARVNTAGDTIVCGNVDCGEEIAWLLEPRGRATQRFIWFPPGWSRRLDGVFVLNQKALTRLAGGHAAVARFSVAGHPTGGGPVGLRPDAFPLEAIPRCGQINIVDARRLDVWTGGELESRSVGFEYFPLEDSGYKGPDLERWARTRRAILSDVKGRRR